MRKVLVALKVALLLSMLSILPVSAQKSSSPVYSFSDMSEMGSATLNRHGNGVTLNVKTTGLEEGATYTIWWVIFNNPGACPDDCSEADLLIPEVQATVLFAAGHVVGNNGKGNFSSHLKEGDTSGLQSELPSFPGDAYGLVDASSAEIHIVVRSHGQPIPGLVHEQIRTFGGGCAINVCLNEQFALFTP
jgi:hypothetical protein